MIPAGSPDQPAGPVASTPYGGALRVMLVENHVDTRRSVRFFLESLGYEVQEAGDGAEACACLEQGVFDVLLSDINLPDVDGRDLLVQASKRGICPRHTIAMSGIGGTDERRRSREAGFERHLVKPFAPLELQDALERLKASTRALGARDETVAAAIPPCVSQSGHRAQIAQRMHDNLCQQLAAAAMWQGMLIRRLEDMAPSERTVEEAQQVSRLLDDALTEARALMRELRGEGV